MKRLFLLINFNFYIKVWFIFFSQNFEKSNLPSRFCGKRDVQYFVYRKDKGKKIKIKNIKENDFLILDSIIENQI